MDFDDHGHGGGGSRTWHGEADSRNLISFYQIRHPLSCLGSSTCAKFGRRLRYSTSASQRRAMWASNKGLPGVTPKGFEMIIVQQWQLTRLGAEKGIHPAPRGRASCCSIQRGEAGPGEEAARRLAGRYARVAEHGRPARALPWWGNRVGDGISSSSSSSPTADDTFLEKPEREALVFVGRVRHFRRTMDTDGHCSLLSSANRAGTDGDGSQRRWASQTPPPRRLSRCGMACERRLGRLSGARLGG